MLVRSALAFVRGLVARYRGVPTSAGQTGLMATDGYRGFGVRHDSDAPYQRYQLKYQHAQQGPHGATQGHTKYHQKASIFDLHTPRTEAAAGKRRIEAAIFSPICVVDTEPEPRGTLHECTDVIRPFNGRRRSVGWLEAASVGLSGGGRLSVALVFGGR